MSSGPSEAPKRPARSPFTAFFVTSLVFWGVVFAIWVSGSIFARHPDHGCCVELKDAISEASLIVRSQAGVVYFAGTVIWICWLYGRGLIRPRDKPEGGD